MKAIMRPQLFIFFAMVLSLALSLAMTPVRKLADGKPRPDLEMVIPKQFGEWVIDESIVPVVNPEVQAALKKIYTQTVARTYVNTHGDRVMLSIAYGSDQRDNLAVHLPEGCYRGQGFAVDARTEDILKTRFGGISVARLIASKGLRIEPVTYWIAIGNQAVYDSWGMKKVKLKYGFKGEVPDAILFRVSTISIDTANGYKLQQNFTDAMMAALLPEQRMKLVGAYTEKKIPLSAFN